MLKSLKELQPSWFYNFKYYVRKNGLPEEISDLICDVFTRFGHLWPWFEGLFTSDEVEYPRINFEELSRKGDSLYVSFEWWYQTTDPNGDVRVNRQDFWDLCLPKILSKIIIDEAQLYISKGWLSKETWDSIPEYKEVI
jgi:hypothetical protein